MGGRRAGAPSFLLWDCLAMARDPATANSASLDAVRLKLRAGNLADALLRPGGQVVLRSAGRELTRDTLRHEADTVGGGLRDLGVGTGDRVAIYAANSLDW